MTTAPNSRDLRTTRPSPRTHKRLTNPQKYFGNQFCSIQFTSTCFCVKCISSNQFEIKHPLNNQPRTNHSSLNNHKPHFQNFFLLDQPPHPPPTKQPQPPPRTSLSSTPAPSPTAECTPRFPNAPPSSPKKMTTKKRHQMIPSTRTRQWCE